MERYPNALTDVSKLPSPLHHEFYEVADIEEEERPSMQRRARSERAPSHDRRTLFSTMGKVMAKLVKRNKLDRNATL